MAALRFEVRADQKGELTRLGHYEIRGNFHTWRTNVYVSVLKDGQVYITINRDGKEIFCKRIKKEQKNEPRRF